jgi:signal transduction histidine kinase
MKRTSLRRQLVTGVLLAELACAALFSGVAVTHEMRGLRRAFDVRLRGRADSILGAVRDAEDPEDNVTVDPTELTLPTQDAYEVLSPTGRVVGASASATPAMRAALESSHQAGYFNFRVGKVRYRAIHFDGIRVIDREEDKGGLRRPVSVLYAGPTRDLWRQTLEAVRFYVAASALLLAGTAVALIWFLRRRLSPLQELAVIAANVSTRSWDFIPPAVVLRTSELAPIALSIEELLKGLRQAFDRQRQLTGDAAHELKTSIAVLKSSLQLLAMNPRTKEEYETGLDGLLLDTERMEDLANRMLALARLEEAPHQSQESTDVQSALQTVAERLRPFAELREVRLQVTAGLPCVASLPADDAEVLCSNLILNALQHSRPAGHVSAVVTMHDGAIELQVTDDGEGIAGDMLPHVFDRFFRADRSRSRNSGGAGLGLSICKAIVERAHGTIRLESELGAGTQVTANLPPAL